MAKCTGARTGLESEDLSSNASSAPYLLSTCPSANYFISLHVSFLIYEDIIIITLGLSLTRRLHESNQETTVKTLYILKCYLDVGQFLLLGMSRIQNNV